MSTPATRGGAAQLGLVLFGVFIASTSVIMIKASSIHPILQSSYRQLFAAFILAPFFFRELKSRGERFSLRATLPSLVPGLLLGLHFITWIYGARLTLAGNSTVIVNMSPVVMPFVALVLLRVRLSPRELIGTAFAVAGVAILAVADYKGGGERFAGDVSCFVAMLLYTVYLALARKNNPEGRLWTYLVPLYFYGGLFCLAVALVLGIDPVANITWVDFAMTLGLAVGPTIVGHSVMNWAMLRFQPQVVSILNLGQFIFAGILAFIIFGEAPEASFYATSVLIVAGAVVSMAPKASAPKRGS
jgi:drug/metabolite transporter (DMT)-like permease